MQRWTNAILNHPWLVISVILVVTIITGAFLPKLVFDASIDAMIPDDDPVLKDLRAVSEDFGSQEMFVVAIEGEDIFKPETLQKMGDLALELESIAGVSEVQSPFNAQLVESSYFGLEIRPVSDFIPQSPEEIEQFKIDILSSPYKERLVTSDGRGAALFLDLSNDKGDRNQIIREIEDVVSKYQGPEEIHTVGDSYVFYYTEKAMKQDLRNLIPFVVVVIASILYLTFKSSLGVLIPLATVGISLIWTMGIMAWYGIPVSMISMVMPVILVTLGIASSIHILNKYQEGLEKGLPKREALIDTFNRITSPVLMAALTTAVGFGSLITAFVKPIKEFGVLTAIGVMIAMGLSLSLVPVLLFLSKKPPVRKKQTKEKDGLLTRILQSFTKVAVNRPRAVTIVSLLLLAVFIFGATRLTLESNIVNYFGESSPVKKGTRVIEDIFGGSMQISVVLDTGKEDGIKDPEILKELIVIQDYLNSWDTINHATSLADVVRELNQALWDGEAEYYAIPDTREGVAQQLLLFTMQGGSGLDALVSYDYSQALVTGQMKTLDAHMLSSVIKEVESHLENVYGSRSDLSVRLTGTPKVMMRLMNRYVQTQVSSLATSTVAVGIIVMLLMKSVTLGLLSLVPLLFTVILNFGFMGFLGLPLDAVTSVIASLAIGIGIDYAIHFISRFKQEKEDGKSLEEALANTGVSAGKGIFFNAIALIVGFLVLVFSHFRAISVFGFLISVTMIVSSLAALIVIPLLLKTFYNRKKEGDL